MLLIIALLFLTTATSTHAYDLSGYVFDSIDNPLADVTVGLEDEYYTIWLLTYTDANGYFEFNDISQGNYIIYVNDLEPIFWQYTGAGIGYNTPMLNVMSDIQINFTLLEIYVDFETNASEYYNGNVIEVNLTVENNDVYDLIDWQVWAELWNETYAEFIDEDYYLVNIDSGKTESFLLYIQIPYDNKYDRFYLDSGIWAVGIEFESSEGILEGELWNWYGIDIFIGEKTKFNISLSKGWNLVSIPLFLIDNILPAPLESIEGKWYSYYAGEAASDKTIDPTIGFWINMTNDDILEVEGYEWQSPLIEFILGWNLIGYPLLEEINVSDILNGINITEIYAYNGSWSSYIPDRTFNSLKTLKPGYGYWVKVE